jgi:hypothetical protein
MKQTLLAFLLIAAPMATAQEEADATGTHCTETACTMSPYVFDALLQAATRTPLPCYMRS